MSMNTRLLLITFLCVFSIGQCIAQTWYTGKDNFRQAIFQDSILSDYNYQAEKDIVNVTETDIHPGEGFRPSLSLDIANRNNRENKKYPVYRQSQTGTITKAGYVEKTVWGVVWGYGDSSNFHALLLRAGNPDPYGYHIPELQYSIITVAEGDTIFHAPWNTLSSPYINPETDYNRIHVVPVNGGYEIFIGKERECRIGICHDDRLFGSSAGVYIGSSTIRFCLGQYSIRRELSTRCNFYSTAYSAPLRQWSTKIPRSMGNRYDQSNFKTYRACEHLQCHLV